MQCIEVLSRSSVRGKDEVVVDKKLLGVKEMLPSSSFNGELDHVA